MKIEELFPGNKEDARIRRILQDYVGDEVSDLILHTEKSLLTIPGIRDRTIVTIKRRLAKHRFTLAVLKLPA